MIRSCDRKLCSTFTYVVVPAIHLLAISLPNTHGQCPPNLPAPPSGGLPAIVEGDLASATIDFGDATVGIDGCGRFLTASAVQRPIDTDLGLLLIQRFFPDGTPDGPVENISVLNPLWPPLMAQGHCTPSVAVSPAGHVRVSWVAECIDCQPNGGPQVVTSDFDFAAPAVPQSAQPGSNSLLNREPSAATSDAVPAGANLGGVAWFNSGAAGTLGLRLDLDATMPEVVRPCGARCFEEWQPAVCMRANGDTVLVWSEAENPLLQDSPFNIALRVQLADGTIVHEIAGQGGGWVNDPVAEIPSSRQLSPAVALSSNGDIVVCWSGSRLLGCSGAGFRVFARRFQWAGGLNPVTIVSEPFIVDNDPDIAAAPLASVNAHPTVALTNSTNPALQGRFVIAWNASRAEVGGGEEIHAQYFDSDGRAMGREFRVNQADGPTDPISGAALRRLGRSAQHSLAYGPDGQVAVAWSSCSDSNPVCGESSTHFTLLPTDLADLMDQDPNAQCLKGDVDRNGVVDGLDIQPFVDLMLAADLACRSIVDICPADIDNNAAVAIEDMPGFVCLLLGVSCGQSGQRGGAGNDDCNANGTPDAADILLGISQDCNANFIPDECDIDPADPDGDGLTSNDLNANGIPDECEPDCNSNGIPDDKDIADATSADLNANGIPDECDPDCNSNGIPDEMDIDPADPDGNGQVSPDCNNNGSPDECEDDCNANGVPDDCDVDPADPDGDGQVSPDCNNNGWPDSCDMAVLPPFGSLDCNANGIPDECDIASGTSQDCNANSFPDECDIAAGISQDANANGIPDECEAQQSQSSGGSSPTSTATTPTLSESETEQAYNDFYLWSLAQQWGPNAPRTCNQQFQAMVDKLRELRLPLRKP